MNKPSNVFAFKREPENLSGMAQRTAALLGSRPMVTFAADDSCCSVRLRRAPGATFLGLVADKAAFTDRVRLAGGRLIIAFVVHVDARTPTICGEVAVQVLGRVGTEGDADIAEGHQAVVNDLMASAAFGSSGQVLICVEPLAIQVDEAEAPVHGAIPRT